VPPRALEEVNNIMITISRINFKIIDFLSEKEKKEQEKEQSRPYAQLPLPNKPHKPPKDEKKDKKGGGGAIIIDI